MWAGDHMLGTGSCWTNIDRKFFSFSKGLEYHNKSTQPTIWLEDTHVYTPSKRAMPTSTGPSESGIGGRAFALTSSMDSSGPGVSVKCLNKTQKRNRRRALARQRQKECEASSVPEENTSLKNVKRTNNEVCNPAPSSIAALVKRQRLGPPPRSNRHLVIGGTKMAIIKRNFPHDKIFEKDEMLIQREIVKLTDEIPSTAPLPRISHSGLVKGAFVICCDDYSTVEWLTSTFHKNDKVIESTQLMVVKASALSKPYKVAFKHKDVHTKDPQVLLRRIDRLNPELNAVDWRVLGCQTEPQYIRWIFEVGIESLAAIKRANYIAYAGLDRGFFKILYEPKWTNLATASGTSVPDKVTVPQPEPEAAVPKSWHLIHGSGAEKSIEDSMKYPIWTNWDSYRNNLELLQKRFPALTSRK